MKAIVTHRFLPKRLLSLAFGSPLGQGAQVKEVSIPSITDNEVLAKVRAVALNPIDFKDIDNAPDTFSSELRKRGVAVVRGVVPEQEALQWKEDLREYIRQNPQTKGKETPVVEETQLTLS